MLKPLLGFDKRVQHKDEVVKTALEITIPEFGDYKLIEVNVNMTPARALLSTEKGDLINLNINPQSALWNKGAIEIKVPIRMGLLSYRLLLIKQQQKKAFSQVNTLNQLNQYRAGMHSDWVTTQVFLHHHLKLVTGHNFEGLFQMLNKQRFDYFPRTIYEAFDESNKRKIALPNIVIEPHLALYIPMATYVYVSKNHPRLAKRMKLGLEKLAQSGKLKQILEKYYANDIKQARLQERTIITIPNPYFNDHNIMKNKLLWYQFEHKAH